MKIRIELTDEHIQLISSFRFTKITDSMVGVDTYDLYGGGNVWFDMACILNATDKIVEGTLERPFGPEFKDGYKEHLQELDEFIVSNMENIQNILHQFCKTGLKPGIYEAQDYEQIWSFKDKNAD